MNTTDFVVECHTNISDRHIEYVQSRGGGINEINIFKVGCIKTKVDECDKNCKVCDECKLSAWSSRHIDKITYPIISYSGSVIGIQARSIVKKEYDTFMISRRPEVGFFGLGQIDEIFKTGILWVAEGPADAMVIRRLTGQPTIALMTNTIGYKNDRVKFFTRFVKKVYVCLDTDQAGKEGKKSIISLVDHGVEVFDVKYTSSQKDPADTWSAVGDEVLKKRLLSSV